MTAASRGLETTSSRARRGPAEKLPFSGHSASFASTLRSFAQRAEVRANLCICNPTALAAGLHSALRYGFQRSAVTGHLGSQPSLRLGLRALPGQRDACTQPTRVEH